MINATPVVNVITVVDWDGLGTFLNENPECVICNMHERKDNGTLCDHYLGGKRRGCGKLNFNSAPAGGQPTRCAVSTTVGKLFNVPRASLLGAHHIYFYMYHQNCAFANNFDFPPVPQMDVRGKMDNKSVLLREIYMDNVKNMKEFKWIIHHINGRHWDNRKENLALVLNTEHGVLHSKSMPDRQRAELIQCIVDRNKDLFGDPCWGDEV